MGCIVRRCKYKIMFFELIGLDGLDCMTCDVKNSNVLLVRGIVKTYNTYGFIAKYYFETPFFLGQVIMDGSLWFPLGGFIVSKEMTHLGASVNKMYLVCRSIY